MTVIATESPRFSNLVKDEDNNGRFGMTRQEVVVNVASETTLKLGSVLGKITASGKYVPSDPDASDGSEAAAAVFLFGPDAIGNVEATEVTIPATTDTTVIVLKPKVGAYAVVAEQALVFDVAHDAGETATALAELEAAGIHTVTQA